MNPFQIGVLSQRSLGLNLQWICWVQSSCVTLAAIRHSHPDERWLNPLSHVGREHTPRKTLVLTSNPESLTSIVGLYTLLVFSSHHIYTLALGCVHI